MVWLLESHSGPHITCDSGGTSHMTSNQESFAETDLNAKAMIFLADGKNITAEGIGYGFLSRMILSKRICNSLVKDVLFPDLKQIVIKRY